MQSTTRRSRHSAATAAAGAAPAAAATGVGDGSRSAQQPAQMYVISCRRTSKVVKYDKNAYVDPWAAPIEDVQEEIDACATGRYGSWFFDMGCHPNWGPIIKEKDQHPDKKPTPGLSRSPGTVRVFGSLAAANAAAALVWQSLQVNHGFDAAAPEATAGREGSKVRKGAAGVKYPWEYVLQDKHPWLGSQGPGLQGSVAVNSSSSGAAGLGMLLEPEGEPDTPAVQGVRTRSAGKRSRSRAAASSGSSSSSDDKYCSVTSDGRCSWSRTRQYYVDPWSSPGSKLQQHNLVSSTLAVAVVKAQAEW